MTNYRQCWHHNSWWMLHCNVPYVGTCFTSVVFPLKNCIYCRKASPPWRHACMRLVEGLINVQLMLQIELQIITCSLWTDTVTSALRRAMIKVLWKPATSPWRKQALTSLVDRGVGNQLTSKRSQSPANPALRQRKWTSLIWKKPYTFSMESHGYSFSGCRRGDFDKHYPAQ